MGISKTPESGLSKGNSRNTRNDKGPRKTETAWESLKFGICLRQGDNAADETASLLFRLEISDSSPAALCLGMMAKLTLEIVSGKKMTAWELVIPE